MNYSAVIVAAGQGKRMHLGYNKVYYRINGVTILEITLKPFLEDAECRQIILVTDEKTCRQQLGDPQDPRIVFAPGGETRQQSVAHGVSLVQEDVVFVHDGARPYVTVKQLQDLKQALEQEQAACLMVPSKDTVKRVSPEGYVVETLPRDTLMCAQTPQAFRTELLRECLARAEADHFTATDDAALVEKYTDVRVRVVAGSYANRKITTPEDLR